MDLIALHRELIQTPSLYGEEHQVISLIESTLWKMGVPTTNVGFDPDTLKQLRAAQAPFCTIPDRRNLIAQVPGHGGGKSLILNSHLDIVPPGDLGAWTDSPFSGRIVDGFIYGRGAYDDKAGAAICISVLDQVKKQNLAGDVIVHFVLEDETTGNGTLLCLEKGPHADAAIIVDGTRGDRGINEHAGNIKLRITAFGKPASVSVSHMGLNAAEFIARTCIILKSHVHGLNQSIEPPWTQFPTPNQLSTIALKCEEVALTVPERADAILYATFTPPHTVNSFVSMIQKVATKASLDAGMERPPELCIEFATEPVRSQSPKIEQAICLAAGREIPFGPSTGTSDMRHFVDRKIPCVLFGPGRGYNPHRPNERFDLESLSEMTLLLTRVACEWCK